MVKGDEPAGETVVSHRLGQDIALLSVDELQLRIAGLKDEIVRLERELASRDQTRTAAEALFRRG